MTDGTIVLLSLGGIAIIASAAHGWFSDKSRRISADEFNRELKIKLEYERLALEKSYSDKNQLLNRREKYVSEMKAEFEHGITAGRSWLARFIAEADRAYDETIAHSLRVKKHPALKAAEEVAEARAERRKAVERAKFLEFQLRSLKEYFPFLDEYEDLILDESIPLSPGAENQAALEEADPVLKYVEKNDYQRMSDAERNQLALERYLSGGLSKSAVGKLYELSLGSRYESDGWSVEYKGIVSGLEDMGRDLICSKGSRIEIVQAKCWSKEKTIHEKHIFQLFGTTQLYLMDRGAKDLFSPNVGARFITSTKLSPLARKAAEILKIEIEEGRALDKSFPMIKCNISKSTGQKIYHLPFDQQYDRTRITPRDGECYVATTKAAEKLGFRRAFRHHF